MPDRARGAEPPAEPPPAAATADSTLGGFLRTLADSSDIYFGASAAPADTAGRDSLLAHYLAHPDSIRLRRAPRWGYTAPLYRYSRVDGSAYGGRLWWGGRNGAARFEVEPWYAEGPNEWLGRSRLLLRRVERRATWSFDGGWEKRTQRLGSERAGSSFGGLRALVNGSDRNHYYRREGARIELRRESDHTTLVAGYRDQREEPLAVTKLWNLLGDDPAVDFNLPARSGRARAFEYGAGTALGSGPLLLWGAYETSSRRLESDFEYRRYRVVAGLPVPVTSWSALNLQAVYGRLSGEHVPQAAFYLGGSHSLRSLPGYALAGTRLAFLRGELVLAPDLLAASRLPHPDFLSLQAGAFAASGAVWGQDPFSGRDIGGSAWPDPRDWRSEVGLSLLYRPGLPDPLGYFRVDVAWPVGGHGGGHRLSVGYARLLELVPGVGR